MINWPQSLLEFERVLFVCGHKEFRDQTLQRPNSSFSFKCLSTDPNGRFVIAKIKLGDEDFFLDDEDFFLGKLRSRDPSCKGLIMSN